MHLSNPAFIPRAISVSLLCSLFVAVPAQAVSEEDLENFGDVAQFALPAIGLGATWIYDDWDGTKQWAWSGLTAVGTTTVLKGVYQKVRPNASTSATSFPSGHTTAAVWGAAFLDQRYGRWWGIPAYAAAGVTAYSRVLSDNHHVDDTVMGASIALMSSWYWVSPHDSAISLIPYQQNDAVGVLLNFNGDVKGGAVSRFRDDDRWRYSIVFGPAWQQKNEVTAPTDSGTTFDLNNFKETNDPTTTANAIIEWYAGRHRTLFSFEPFEARDFGEFSEASTFSGQVYPADTEIRSAYRLIDVRLQYGYDLMVGGPWTVEVGAGIAFQRTIVELATTDDTQSSEATSRVWLPLVNALVAYDFTPRWSAAAELSGLSLGDDEQLDANISVGYRFDRYWDAGIGYGIYQREAEVEELYNKAEYELLMTYVGYSFY